MIVVLVYTVPTYHSARVRERALLVFSEVKEGQEDLLSRCTLRDALDLDSIHPRIKSMLIKLINYEARLAKVEKKLVAVLERKESLTIALREAVEHIQSVTAMDERIQSV